MAVICRRCAARIHDGRIRADAELGSDGLPSRGHETCHPRADRNDLRRRLVRYDPGAARRQSDYSDGRLPDDRRLSENRAGGERRPAAACANDARTKDALQIDPTRRRATALFGTRARIRPDPPVDRARTGMVMARIDLNCDMGESFGAYTMGNDLPILDYVNSANIACGFHAGDPPTIHKTVKAALDKGVAVGAHPAFPDLQGFG